MKKLLLALLFFTGLVAIAPPAEAGQYARVWNGHCYVNGPRISHHRYSCAPRQRVTYCPPVRYYYAPVRSYHRGYGYRAPVRHYHGGPRISFSFGF